MVTRSGYFNAVAWTPQGWRVVCGGWPTLDLLIVSDIHGNTLAEQTVPGGALNFVRCAASPDGVIAWVAQGLGDTMVRGLIQPDLSISAEVTSWPAYGQSGINVGWLNGGFVYYGMNDGYHYYTVTNDAPSQPIRNPFAGGTSQGWIDVFDGNLRWIDIYRNDPAQELLFPTSLSGVTLGQNAYNAAGDYVGGYSPSGQRFMAAQVLGQEPTLALSGDGSEWAWSARLLNGLIGFGTLPPFPAAPVVTVPEPPEPEPEPPKPEPPKPPQPKTDTLNPDDVLGVDQQIWSKNRRYRFVNQSDGNGVLYDVSSGAYVAVWATNTTTLGLYFIMQSDGNLVAYNGSVPPSQRVGLWASDTYVPGSKAILVNSGHLVIVSPSGEVLRAFPGTGPEPPDPPDPPDPPGPVEWATGADLLRVRGNFCNLWDSAGRIVYTPALTGASPSVFADWMRIQREAGSTHVFFGPLTAGPAYPGVPWSNPDFWSDLPRFRAFVEQVLNTPSADGKGLRPVIFVGNDTFAQSHFNQWQDLADALAGLHEYLIVLPAWEPVIGGWTSNELSQGLVELGQCFPTAVLAWHGSPTRWVGSSNPLEDDDPWQGGESDFFKEHGGESVQLAFYQTPHGSDIYTPCECPNAELKFGHEDECWLNRWEDGVSRLGTGYNGWRVLDVVLYETVAYEAFRGQATSQQAREVARAGKTVSDKWGIETGYGNGLP